MKQKLNAKDFILIGVLTALMWIICMIISTIMTIITTIAAVRIGLNTSIIANTPTMFINDITSCGKLKLIISRKVSTSFV